MGSVFCVDTIVQYRVLLLRPNRNVLVVVVVVVVVVGGGGGGGGFGVVGGDGGGCLCTSLVGGL